MEYNQLVHNRGLYKSSITRAYVYAENPAEGYTFEQIEVRLERLEQVWNDFSKCTLEMQKFAELEGYSDPSSDFAVYEEKYLLTCARLRALKTSMTPPETHPEVLSTLAEQQSSFLRQLSTSSHVNELPKINVPQFSGSYKDWPTFRDLFLSSIDKKTNHTSALFKSIVERRS